MPEVATLFLVWQEPGDRALAGWVPYPSIRPGLIDDHSLFNWLREKVRATVGEEDDLARLRAVD